MTNRFGLDRYPKEVRWAAAEGVSEDVIAAVLLLHEHSVEEIVPQLSPLELEKVIELVGRSPRLYPRGILDALDPHRSLTASAPITQSVAPNLRLSLKEYGGCALRNGFWTPLTTASTAPRGRRGASRTAVVRCPATGCRPGPAPPQTLPLRPSQRTEGYFRRAARYAVPRQNQPLRSDPQ